MLFWVQKKINQVCFPNAPRHGPLPPCSIGLTGWSSSAEQACLCSTLMPLQWVENIQSMRAVARIEWNS